MQLRLSFIASLRRHLVFFKDSERNDETGFREYPSGAGDPLP
jgi:hypothetical protein